MKRFIKATTSIYGGARIVDGQLKFDWASDDVNTDVVLLRNSVSGQYEKDGIQYVYAYQYNPSSTKQDQNQFRKFLKDLDPNKGLFIADVDDFVEAGVLALDAYHDLNEFDVTICTRSKKPLSITRVMHQFFTEYCRNLQISFELLKQTYEHVEFDVSRAAAALRQAGLAEADIQDEIDFTLSKFNQLKASGELFEMKRFVPREIRAGFTNFLKFQTDEEAQIYSSLQGVEVLIYDDFLTSGSTVEEIIRYLKSFNESNKLTVFVLVKQH